MASIHNDISLPVPARDVWDAVRDFGALPQRMQGGAIGDREARGLVEGETVRDFRQPRRGDCEKLGSA